MPDDTGTVPSSSPTPQTRPNGSGLVRSLDTVGDRVLFARSGAIEKIDVVEFDSELPLFDFTVPRGTVQVALETGRIAMSNRDRRLFEGERLYFVQANLRPAVYCATPAVGSQIRGPFTLEGSEVLAFMVDGVQYLWSASTLGAGTWTAGDVAASLNAVTGSSTARVVRDRVWIEGEDEVVIGFGSIGSGSFVDRDLSGCAALGFLPGWRAVEGGWLPEGVSFGLRRTSVDLSRAAGVADFRATSRVNGAVLSKRVQPIPMVNLTSVPLEDVAGYDEGVFFVLRDDAFVRYLRPYEEVVYRFDTNRMIWVEPGSIEGAVASPTDTLPLGTPGVLGESLHPALGGGLYLSRAGEVKTLLTVNEDYLLPDNGAQGIARLIEVLGELRLTGAAGSLDGTSFLDPFGGFTGVVQAGDLLKITSGDETSRGVYRVVSVVSDTELELEQTAPVAGAMLTWELYAGEEYTNYDRSLLVGPGEVLVGFDPLGAEVFHARRLTPLNTVGANLYADVGIARELAVRFGGGVADPQANVHPLRTEVLGMVGGRVTPATVDTYWDEAAFTIIVGEATYAGASLIGVSAFTEGLTGDVIEFGEFGSAIQGKLNFGATVLAERSGALVYCRQVNRGVLPAGSAEYNPITGQVTLSATDEAEYYGRVTAFLVETLVAQQDMVLGPVQGSVFLNEPQRAFQVLEVSYTRAVQGSGAKYLDPATGSSVEVTEQLPLYVRLETATRVDSRTYTFNPTDRALREDVPVSVWVGARLITTGNRPRVRFEGSTILFDDDVQVGALVRVNYAVTQAMGGERAFTVSTPPVWRPPLIIPAGETSFTARGDRTAEAVEGCLLTVGPVVYYVRSATLDGSETTIVVGPAAPQEAGTRDPGAASPATISSGPVQPGFGTDGFWRTLDQGFAPVDRGRLSIRVNGDVSEFTRAGHVLDLDGVPALITAATLGPAGVYTDVTVSSPFQRGADPETDTLRVSVRPLYASGVKVTEGGGPLVSRPYADYELIKFAGSSVGQVLVEGEEYVLDPGTGQVTLLAAGLASGDRLFLRQVRAATASPKFIDGMTVLPTYSASYVYETTPSRENGYRGGALTARYTFRAPDTFYARAVTMAEWMGEVQADAVAAVAASNPHGGAPVTFSPPAENKDFGTQSTRTRLRELRDKDWAARRFLSLYDDIIVAFEQVLESIDGRVIGDRDGKFRFFVGRDKTYSPPGWEDSITGSLVPRNLWSMVFEAENKDFTVTYTDPLVEPTTAVQDPVTLEVTGDMMDPDRLEGLLFQQKSLILNDMDDVVVVGSDGVRLHRDPGDLLPRFDSTPGYRGLWEPSAFSRIFPEQILAFGTTYPGIGYDPVTGDPGVYAFRKMVPPVGDRVLPRQASTFFKEILPVENPAFGRARNVEGADVRKRLARGRVVAYSATGFPTLDPSFLTNPRPAVIVSQVELSAFPVLPGSGLPDVTKLASSGGDVPDLTTGDASLSTPPWSALSVGSNVLPQVGYGKPDGTVYQVAYAGDIATSVFGPDTPQYAAVFVGEVLAGCVVTFAWVDGVTPTPVLDAGSLALAGDGEPGSTTPFAPQPGDTIYIVPATGGADIGSDDPPSLSDVQKGVASLPLYRTGFDIGLANRSGKFRDISLPTFLLPLQQLTGQNPVEPVTCIEAGIEFTNGRVNPFIFPALKGERTNDNGDYYIPYLSAPNTELTLLAKAQGVLSSIVETDGAAGAVYPDEVVCSDTVVLGAASGSTPPGALVSADRDFTPVTTAGSYTPHSGIADVRPFDLVLVETGSAGTVPGATGILHVGSVSTHTIFPPKFNAPTRLGDSVGYILENAMVSANADGLSGMTVAEVPGATVLNISSVGGLFFNDASGTATGGLNEILNSTSNPFPNGNLVTIEIIDPTTGVVLETITIEGGTVTGGSGGALITSPVVAMDKTLRIPAQGFVNFGSLGGVAPGPVGPFDFRLSIDTFNLSGPGVKGSFSAQVELDRVTFSEALDLRTCQPRGTAHPFNPALSLETTLAVWAVTASGSASLINSPLYCGGAALTFLPLSATGTVGSFSGGRGSLVALGFEGWSNTPLPTTAPITVSAMPSSDEDEDGPILQGTGFVHDDSNAVVDVSAVSGDLSRVQPGDLLIIQASALGDAAVSSGTYVIHHAVPDVSGSGYAEVQAAATVGSGAGWVRVNLLTVVTSNRILKNIRLDGVQEVQYTDTGYDWSATGRVYLFPSGMNLSAAVSMEYSAFGPSLSTFLFTLVSGSAQDATGASITDAEFFDAAEVDGVVASGASYLPITGAMAPYLPTGNIVAHETGTTHGFVSVTFKNLVGGGQSFSAVADANTLPSYPSTPPSSGDLAVLATDAGAFPPLTGTDFAPTETAPVFTNVPLFLDMRGLFDSGSGWSTLVHGESAVHCLAPGDAVYSYNTLSPAGTAFRAAAGVFVEPSSPRAARDLSDGNPKVVDAAHSGVLGVLDVGLPSPSTFLAPSPEEVSFTVRRVRRWHTVLDGQAETLGKLKYVYEVRQGTVVSYTDRVLTTNGTQLGEFTDPEVNIHPGDLVRLLDGDVVVDTAEIAAIVDGVTLKLRRPGFQEVTPAPGMAFEVYLRQAPVPHLQSNAQLMDLITQEVVLDRTADPSNAPTSGGYVDEFNKLLDGEVPDFSAAGVVAGDYLVVDPAGMLFGPTGVSTPVEYGARPEGDQSVDGRPSFIAGQPSQFDDNRGFYKVLEVGAELTVSPSSNFAGTASTPVIYGAAGQEFVVLPTVSGSTMPVGDNPDAPSEPQQGLRPTRPAGTFSSDPNSYAGGPYSVAPFSYKVIRPVSTVSSESVELVLFIRARMLSWVEDMEAAFEANKQGSYYDFQRDEHIGDLGSPASAIDGVGVPSNVYCTGLSGLTSVAPFESTSDCLSILDRRYWCLDYRLDSEAPPYLFPPEPYASFAQDTSSVGYTVGSGRPALPDQIEEVLERSDRLRQLRAAWIRYRANRVSGTLPAMARLSDDESTAARAAEDLANLTGG